MSTLVATATAAAFFSLSVWSSWPAAASMLLKKGKEVKKEKNIFKKHILALQCITMKLQWF